MVKDSYWRLDAEFYRKYGDFDYNKWRKLTLRDRLRCVKATRISWHVIIREDNNVLYEVIAKRGKLDIDAIPKRLLKRSVKHTGIDNTRFNRFKPTSIYFDL